MVRRFRPTTERCTAMLAHRRQSLPTVSLNTTRTLLAMLVHRHRHVSDHRAPHLHRWLTTLVRLGAMISGRAR